MADVGKRYIGEYVEFLGKFLRPERDIKVVFDCSNGTTAAVLKNLRTEKLKTFFINEKADGHFLGHGPDPLKKGALDDLKKAVVEKKADLGVVFDADGDRMFLVDNKGRFIADDVDAYLLVQYLKPRKVVADQRIGWLIRGQRISDSGYRTSDIGYRIIDSRVGHYFIKKKMKEVGADFGIEETGHYYFKEFFGMDSGILAAIYAINAVSRLPYAFSDFCDLLPKYPRIEKDYKLRITDYGLFKEIEKEYRGRAKKILKLDGIKMEFGEPRSSTFLEKERSGEDGVFWFGVRMSSTEPVLRVVMEASNKETLDREMDKLTAIIKKGTK